MMIAAAAAAAGALGSRCTWLGAGKGTAKRWHRSSHIMQAELSCLQIESRGDLVAERAERNAFRAHGT
nr:unnamed protein product [Rangifer tarandus platyrhynchus]